MARYHGYGTDTNTASTTQWNLANNSTAIRRLYLYGIQLGSSASADNSFASSVRRTTAAGTAGTSFTPVALDPDNGAASAAFGYNHSGEPTYTSNSELLVIAGHQRTTYQWYAPPGGELIVPKTNSAGLGYLTTVAASAFSQRFSVYWDE